MSDYEDLYALDDELFSMAFVPEGVPGASIPVVDVIAFECGHSVLGRALHPRWSGSFRTSSNPIPARTRRG